MWCLICPAFDILRVESPFSVYNCTIKKKDAFVVKESTCRREYRNDECNLKMIKNGEKIIENRKELFPTGKIFYQPNSKRFEDGNLTMDFSRIIHKDRN